MDIAVSIPDDLTTVADLSATLNEVSVAVSQLIDVRKRLQVLVNADLEREAINAKVLNAQGRKPGDPWAQPLGNEAYPLSWEVTHNGKEWVSTAPFNVWEPGVAGWTEKAPEPEEPGGPVIYDFTPRDATNGYPKGTLVRHFGVVYESLLDTPNVWSPSDYPQGWLIRLDLS